VLRIIHLLKLLMEGSCCTLVMIVFCVADITTMYQIQGYPSTLRKETRMAYILAVLLHVRTYGH